MSPVIGAVLVFGLVTLAFFLFTLNQLPQWIEDNEYEHTEEGSLAIRTFQDQLFDAMAGQRIQRSLRLDAPEVAFLQPAESAGSIGVRGSLDWEWSFLGGQRLSVGNQVIGNPSEPLNGASASGIAAILGGRIVVTLSNANNNQESAVLAFNDGSSSLSLTITHRTGNQANICSDSDLTATVTVNGAPLQEQLLQCDLPGAATYTIGLTDTGIALDQRLEDTQTGYALTGSTPGGMNAQFQGLFQTTGGGRLVLGSTPQATGPQTPRTSASLIFDPLHYEAVDQRVISEFGATFLDQADGSSLQGSQPFNFQVNPTVDRLRVQSLNYVGDTTIGGKGIVSLEGIVSSCTERVLSVTGFTLTFNSQTSSGWASALGEAIDAANIGARMTVATTPDQVTLTYAGGGRTLILEERTCSVDVEIRA